VNCGSEIFKKETSMYRYLLYFLMIFALPVQASQKQALVIGNGAYPDKWQLSNPVNDATDVAAALENLGFKVTVLTDKNKRSMSNAVQNFASGLQNGDVALFYFSGHGFSGKDPNAHDTNFLVGSFQEMVRTRDALEEESIDASFVVRSLRSKNAQGINVMILDACRNVPTGFLEEHKGTFEEGLVSLGKYERFIMNYATQPLKKALGSKNQRNSVYTQYLVEGLKNRSLTSKNISEFFNEVGLTMADVFGDKQIPLVEMSPVRFCFAGCGGVVQQAPDAPAYVPPVSKPAPVVSRSAIEPEMVLIPAGTFSMGSETGYSDEKPVHAWKMGEFYMSKYETTFEEYDAFASATGRSKPSDEGWGRGKRPVINVSWQDAVAYAEWLSGKTGKVYRLPTEAEWEYAARAGSTTKYWWGDNIGSNKANCRECGSQWYNKQTAPVGSFSPNGFGLYDTVGNVWEWTCSDKGDYTDKKEIVCNQSVTGRRVVRGGSWDNEAYDVRSAFRGFDDATNRGSMLGFRLISVP
jgi:formylglycine-generating enzyme required for sulfatase activity